MRPSIPKKQPKGINRFSSINELVNLASDIPEAVLLHLTELEKVDLNNYFLYESNLYIFGERLALLAGLALCSIYVRKRLGEFGDLVSPDPYMDDHIKTILFLRGYSRGIACAVIQQAGIYQEGSFGELIKDDRLVTEFITRRPNRILHMIQRNSDEPLEHKLMHLISHLTFFKRLHFDSDNNTVTFDNCNLKLTPFISWNGHIIERFSHLRYEEGGSPSIVWSRWSEGAEKSFSRALEPDLERTLRRLASVFGVPGWEVPGPNQESLPQSVLPLFAESYPTLNRLAKKLFLESDTETRKVLWIDHQDEEGNDGARDEITVTNAIIHKCLDQDPISVLQQYFVEQPHDPIEFFRWVQNDDKAVQATIAEIENEAKTYDSRLRAYYMGESIEDIREHINRVRSRLVAKRLVKLLGFPVIEERRNDDLTDFERWIKVFSNQLATMDSIDMGKAHFGLMQFARDIETLLWTIILFYKSISCYCPNESDGLDDSGRREIHIFARQLADSKAGLGKRIGILVALNKDDRLLGKIQDYLGRNAIWPEITGNEHIDTLNRLNELRNRYIAHGKEYLRIRDIIDITDRLIEFIRWLGNASPNSASGSWRIYPAILGLDVITTNSCGIVSMRYRLNEIRRDLQIPRKITLYTSQPLSFASGTYYGLPHNGRVMHDLWVDPVLISSRDIPFE